MPETSAGILPYRLRSSGTEVLLIHPGGPFWTRKDEGAWSIPKGLHEPDEDPEAAARREFAEETGFTPTGKLIPLGTFRQPSGKLVAAWAAESDFDPTTFRSNLFSIEWPPRSGRMQDFPEADRAEWFPPDAARRKILKGQVAILEALLSHLAGRV